MNGDDQRDDEGRQVEAEFEAEDRRRGHQVVRLRNEFRRLRRTMAASPDRGKLACREAAMRRRPAPSAAPRCFRRSRSAVQWS